MKEGKLAALINYIKNCSAEELQNLMEEIDSFKQSKSMNNENTREPS